MKSTACLKSFGLLKCILASSAQTYCKAFIIKEESTGKCTKCLRVWTHRDFWAGHANTVFNMIKFPYGGWCLELENFASCETNPCYSTSAKLCFEKERDRLSLAFLCCGPCSHFQKEELCPHAALTQDAFWSGTQAPDARGLVLMGCHLLRWDRRGCNDCMWRLHAFSD